MQKKNLLVMSRPSSKDDKATNEIKEERPANKSTLQYRLRSAACPEVKKKVMVIVELPPGASPTPKRKFKVPSGMTIGELTDQLAQHLKVAGGNWRLYGSPDKKMDSSYILGRNSSVNDFSLNKNNAARLYFYPEMRV